MAWTLYGEYWEDLRQGPTFAVPTVVSVCTLSTTTPITLYAGRDVGSPTIPNPLATGQPVGTPGIDIAGNLYFYAPPGRYTLIIGGVTYPPLTVQPDPDELVSSALGSIPASALGAPNGVATLDSSAHLTVSQSANVLLD